MTLTFGLVGGGMISHTHIAGATYSGKAVLKAGCFSRDHQKNIEYGLSYSIDINRVYTDYMSMAENESIREDRLDFVIVATPNVSHFEISLAFMKHGFNVVCDKPLTVTGYQANILKELAEKNGLICATSYTFGGFPFLHLTKDLLQSGEIGKPYYISLKYYRGSRLAEIYENKIKTWRFTKAISGQGGTIADLGTHVEYLARFIVGDDFDKVLARLINKPGKVELDTTGTVILKYKNGLDGAIYLAQAACGHDNDIEIEILGERGSINWNFSHYGEVKVDYLDGRSIIHREPGVEYESIRQFDSDKPSLMNAPVIGFINIYSGYINTLISKKNSENKSFYYPTFSDGIKGVLFIEACLKSQESDNTWVCL
jgi:predicted dehydrogenase